MLQIFPLIFIVVALQFALCLGGCPRAITSRYAEFNDKEIVTDSKEFAQKINEILSQLKAKIQGPKEPLEKISEFEKCEQALQSSEKALNKEEAALENIRFQNPLQMRAKTAGINQRRANISTKKADLAKLKDQIAEQIIQAGNIGFVPGSPNCITFPPELQEIFKEMNNRGILFGYIFAYPREGIDLSKPLEESDLKKIISIEKGKFFYQALEFTIPNIASPFGTLRHSLGSVRKGEFKLELGSDIYRNYAMCSKTISEIFAFYVTKQFVPQLDFALKISPHELFLKTVQGNITVARLTISTEFSTADGKITRSEVMPMNKELFFLLDKTLVTVAEMKQKELAGPIGLALDDVRVKFILTFTYV